MIAKQLFLDIYSTFFQANITIVVRFSFLKDINEEFKISHKVCNLILEEFGFILLPIHIYYYIQVELQEENTMHLKSHNLLW